MRLDKSQSAEVVDVFDGLATGKKKRVGNTCKDFGGLF